MGTPRSGGLGVQHKHENRKKSQQERGRARLGTFGLRPERKLKSEKSPKSDEYQEEE